MGAALFLVVAAAMAGHALGWLPAMAVDAPFAGLVGFGLFSILRLRAVGRRRARMIAEGLTLAGLAVMLWIPGARLAPYFGIAVINALVAYVFSRGLNGDRPVVIRQVIRLAQSGPDGDLDWIRYVNLQSALWTVFGAATAGLAVCAMVSPAWRAGLGGALGGFALFQIAWFVLTHYYAQRRYGRVEGWRDTLRDMSRPEIWRRIDL